MKSKLLLFRKSLGTVWDSAPRWALGNVLISIFRGFIPLVLIWLIKLLIDGITGIAASPGASMDRLLWLIIAVVLIWFLDEVSSDLGTFVRKKQSVKLEGYMYGLLHKKAVRLDLHYFENPVYYDCLTRAAREAPWRPNSILNNIVSLFRGTISLVLMAGILFTFHWILPLLLILVNIPAMILRFHYADILYNFRREQTPEARKMAYFNWLLTGSRPSREVRLFGLGDYFQTLFNRSFSGTKEEEVKIVGKRTRIDLFSDLFKAVAVFGMFFFIAKETINGELTFGEMSMYILAFRQGMVYLKDLFGSVSGLYEDSLFVGDTFEFLDLDEKVIETGQVKKIKPMNNVISISNLTFTYPGNPEPTIKNITLDIKKGEVVALVGPNGAGKSTLARLLSGLYQPSEGSINWDGTDIRNYDPKSFRKLISVVFQDFMLYNMTVEENIRIGDIDGIIDSNRIVEVAKASGIHEFVNSLPKGYQTMIGPLFDESRELSWGEWQKLALSRALYREADIIILDEPSSALDADTEYEIFNKFREIVKGRTSILISHRFSNVSLADRIVVIENGGIAEMGTHDELIHKKGKYRSMYEKQVLRNG